MKDSGIEWIGEIPDNIPLWRIKFLVSAVKGKIPKTLNKEGLGFPYIGAFEMNGNQVTQYTDSKDIVCCNKKDILILWDGANAGLVATGKVGVVSSTVIRLRLLSDKVHSLYLFYLLKYAEKYFRDKVSGTTIPHMSFSHIDDIPFIAFYYNTQQRIADFLDDKCAKIDSLIAHEEATIEELKAYKQSVITEAVTKGLDKSVPMKYSGVEWIGKIPKSWEILRIKNLGWTQNGISKSGDFFGQGYPFVSYGDVYKNMVLPRSVNGLIETTEQERNNYSVKENDIFFTRTSETIEEVGFSCVCKETIPNATFAGFLIRLRLFEDKKIQIDYAKYYFRGIQIRNYLVKEMNLVTRASLGQDLLKAMSVTLPPMVEQQQIAEYLDKKCADIDNLISIKLQKIEELKEYKKSLIYEYVTGKKEVA